MNDNRSLIVRGRTCCFLLSLRRRHKTMYECLVEIEHLCDNNLFKFHHIFALFGNVMYWTRKKLQHFSLCEDFFYGRIKQVIFALEKVQSADKIFHHLSIIDDQAGKWTRHDALKNLPEHRVAFFFLPIKVRALRQTIYNCRFMYENSYKETGVNKRRFLPRT